MNRHLTKLRLLLLIMFFAAAGGCDGCDGCGCNRDRDGSAASEGGSEGARDDEALVPADPFADVDLPLTASRTPLPEGTPPIVIVTPSAVSLSGEVIGSLSAGAISTTADATAMLESLGARLMGLTADEGAQVLIAPDRSVEHHVVSVLLETVHDIGAQPLLVAVDVDGVERLVPFDIPSPEEVAADANFRPRRDRPTTASPLLDEIAEAAPHRVRIVEAGFGLPTLGLGIGRSPNAANVIQITAHPAGVWLLGGTIRHPLGGLLAVAPRSPRHPNFPGSSAWPVDGGVVHWVDWAGLQAQLVDARVAAEARAIVLRPRVGIDSNLPYELLVRLIDVVQFGVPRDALQSGADFDELFLSAEQRTELLRPPAIMLSR